MKNYVIYDVSSGEITRYGSCQDVDFENQGSPIIEGVGKPSLNYVQNGQILNYTSDQILAKANKPFMPGTYWDNTTFSWFDPTTLASAQAAKNLEINSFRLNANESSFTYSGKQIATDELSRSDIDGVNGYVSLNNAFPNNWPGGWKAMDNSIVLIPDIATWKLFYNTMVQTGLNNFLHSQYLKGLVAAATTISQVNAINWDTP
jgi:hypothetical protein